MRHQILISLSAGLVLFFALLNIHIPTGTPTGAVVEAETTYAFTINHLVKDFFDVEDVIFPIGSCGEVARELYGNIAYTPTDVTSGFSTRGPDRLATIDFVIDRIERFGTIDMAIGESMRLGKPLDSFISINAESIVRVPKDTRSTYYLMDLHASANGLLYITSGQFSTPSVDCDFTTKDGFAICDCQVHRIYGIETGGITALRPLPPTKV